MSFLSHTGLHHTTTAHNLDLCTLPVWLVLQSVMHVLPCLQQTEPICPSPESDPKSQLPC